MSLWIYFTCYFLEWPCMTMTGYAVLWNWIRRANDELCGETEDFLNQVFNRKKTVGFFQTCLKRIRLDMPLTHEDFMGNDGKEYTHIFVQQNGRRCLSWCRILIADSLQYNSSNDNVLWLGENELSLTPQLEEPQGAATCRLVCEPDKALKHYGCFSALWPQSYTQFVSTKGFHKIRPIL